MTRNRGSPEEGSVLQRPSRAKVSMMAIRRFAREVADQFEPHKIVLFGSYAYGRPDGDSDVDILVVMPAKNATDQAIRIRRAIAPNFPVDLIVRTPRYLAWALKEGDWFLREVTDRGKVLYDRDNKVVGEKGRRRLSHRRESAGGKNAAS